MGVSVFERHSNGYTLNRAGESILASAQTIENEFISLNNQATGSDNNLNGSIRIATTDLLASTLMPEMWNFLLWHPDINFEVIGDSFTVDLANREADIVIRITNPAPKEHLLSRKIGVVTRSIYASDAYLERHLNKVSKEHTWIGWDDNLSQKVTRQFMDDYIPENAKISCKVNSGISLLQAIKSGIGLGYLWDFIGNNTPEWQRIDPDQEYALDLFLLFNKDLYSTPRFRVVMGFLEESIRKKVYFQRWLLNLWAPSSGRDANQVLDKGRHALRFRIDHTRNSSFSTVIKSWPKWNIAFIYSYYITFA